MYGRCLSSTRMHRPTEWKRDRSFRALLARSAQAERDNEPTFRQYPEAPNLRGWTYEKRGALQLCDYKTLLVNLQARMWKAPLDGERVDGAAYIEV
ncbi:hypothetical protein EVAR_24351_1 [Eumeta japonica]|uniref:Uncharacterized protein n=1 Tax=Eumeta variegata TaxID=151549 RepID=A0A4C1VJT4_EUMVA|nr:hypothetical protein EVAR_24351_1 [Eumeta japonica]